MMQLDLQRDAAEKALDAVATELDTLQQDCVQTSAELIQSLMMLKLTKTL